MIKAFNNVIVPVISIITLILVIPVLAYMTYCAFKCSGLDSLMKVLSGAIIIYTCIHINEHL